MFSTFRIDGCFIAFGGRDGFISLYGLQDRNSFLSETLSITNRNGAVHLADLVISGQFDVENRDGFVNLRNIIADRDRFNVTNRNGVVNVSDS